MSLIRNAVSLLTLFAFVASHTYAGQKARAAQITAEQIKAGVEFYNEHLDITKDLAAYGPHLDQIKDAEKRGLWTALRKSVDEGKVQRLPMAVADGMKVTLDLDSLPDGKGKKMVFDFSMMDQKVLKINDKPLAWDPKVPVEKRVQELRMFIEKEYGPEHASFFSLIPEAHAVAIIVIILIAAAVALLAAIFGPGLSRGKEAGEKTSLSSVAKACKAMKLALDAGGDAANFAPYMGSIEANPAFIEAKKRCAPAFEGPSCAEAKIVNDCVKSCGELLNGPAAAAASGKTAKGELPGAPPVMEHMERRPAGPNGPANQGK